MHIHFSLLWSGFDLLFTFIFYGDFYDIVSDLASYFLLFTSVHYTWVVSCYLYFFLANIVLLFFPCFLHWFTKSRGYAGSKRQRWRKRREDEVNAHQSQGHSERLFVTLVLTFLRIRAKIKRTWHISHRRQFFFSALNLFLLKSC